VHIDGDFNSLNCLGVKISTVERMKELEDFIIKAIIVGLIEFIKVGVNIASYKLKSVIKKKKSVPKMRETMSPELLRACEFFRKGKNEYERGDYEEALTYYEVALPVFKEKGEMLDECKTLLSLSIVENILVKHGIRKREIYTEQAKVSYGFLNDDEKDSELMRLMGNVYSRGHGYEATMRLYKESLSIAMSQGDTLNHAETLLFMGILEGVAYSKREHKTKMAKFYLSESIRKYEEVKDSFEREKGQARVFQSLGDLMREQGSLTKKRGKLKRAQKEYFASAKYYESAWVLHNNIDDPRRKYFIMGELCRIYALINERHDEAKVWKKKCETALENESDNMPAQSRDYISKCLKEAQNLLQEHDYNN